MNDFILRIFLALMSFRIQERSFIETKVTLKQRLGVEQRRADFRSFTTTFSQSSGVFISEFIFFRKFRAPVLKEQRKY